MATTTATHAAAAAITVDAADAKISDTAATSHAVLRQSRTVAKDVEAYEQREGDGVIVRRSVGGSELRNLDPFLLLDEAKLGMGAGFPDHPHRGFETVSYVIEGKTEHEDSGGHRGVIEAGGVQWMTAGRGIMHAEIPAAEVVHGIQLWVNLAAKDKMCEPQYQDLRASQIPEATYNNVTARIIAGEAFGVKSPVLTRTPAYYLDFSLKAGATLKQKIEPGWNALVYVLSGTALVGPDEHVGTTHHTLVLSVADGQDGIVIKAKGGPCRLLLIAGKPIGEPIVQYGPFVMNTQEQIRQAFSDFQSGRNGFEKAYTWQSTIGHRRR